MERLDSDRIQITYQLTLREGERAEVRARQIALEQTVELPDGCYPDGVEERVVGRIEDIEDLGSARWELTLSYDPVLVGSETTQLLNLLFGNVSMHPGTLVTDLQLPAALVERFPGPQHGIAGVRAACGDAEDRPLLCTAAKPVGLSTDELARICGALARGGVDVVKDDHGVTDQALAPFRERVERCQAAVSEANASTGGSTLYFPNVTAPVSRLPERLEWARSAGCRGVLVSPFLTGLDTVRWLAADGGMIVVTHPTFSGALLAERHGVAADVMLGLVLRLLGADAVIYVNAGGRFPIGEAECQAINARLRQPYHGLARALPVPGGGVDVDRVPRWIERYGTDLMFLIGSSLYAQGDLEAATRRLVQSVREQSRG
jgi:ribulose-bisphosphate carboxylase large chain